MIKTWTGATSNAWNVAGNWSPAGVPASTDTVRFASPEFVNQLEVPMADQTVAAIVIEGDSVAEVNFIAWGATIGNLQVTGNLTMTTGVSGSSFTLTGVGANIAGTITLTNTVNDYEYANYLTMDGINVGGNVTLNQYDLLSIISGTYEGSLTGGNVDIGGGTFNGIVNGSKHAEFGSGISGGTFNASVTYDGMIADSTFHDTLNLIGIHASINTVTHDHGSAIVIANTVETSIPALYSSLNGGVVNQSLQPIVIAGSTIGPILSVGGIEINDCIVSGDVISLGGRVQIENTNEVTINGDVSGIGTNIAPCQILKNPGNPFTITGDVTFVRTSGDTIVSVASGKVWDLGTFVDNSFAIISGSVYGSLQFAHAGSNYLTFDFDGGSIETTITIRGGTHQWGGNTILTSGGVLNIENGSSVQTIGAGGVDGTATINLRDASTLIFDFGVTLSESRTINIYDGSHYGGPSTGTINRFPISTISAAQKRQLRQALGVDGPKTATNTSGVLQRANRIAGYILADLLRVRDPAILNTILGLGGSQGPVNTGGTDTDGSFGASELNQLRQVAGLTGSQAATRGGDIQSLHRKMRLIILTQQGHLTSFDQVTAGL